MAKSIMIQGTMSGAGKSLLVTALCRIFRQDGFRVAPFKSQNMALNSCVTADGLEMGRAQAVQAEAAGKEPDVRMNPILLKPSSDVGSQVIVNGEVRGDYRARDYFRMKRSFIPDILAAYNSLAAENDIIVIEGAGSPAEINLKQDDIVNMGLAELVDAPVLLAGDIDPGGVFAQLYGTIALLTPAERARVKGTIINKFRGDVSILEPGIAMIEDLTGVPVVGTVPYMQVDIDDEDSLSARLAKNENHVLLDVAVIRLPRISNFTDFSPLEEHPAMGVRYISALKDLGSPDLVILPGTKSTMSDLRWLNETGLAGAIRRLAAGGTPILGVCGGFQMLGRQLSDPSGSDGGGEMPGLALLPAKTVFEGEKTRRLVRARVSEKVFGISAEDSLCSEESGEGASGESVSEEGNAACVSAKSISGEGSTACVSAKSVSGEGNASCISAKSMPGEKATDVSQSAEGVCIDGYEIHVGVTEAYPEAEAAPFCVTEDGRPDGLVQGNVFGTYMHGLFDSGALVDRLASFLADRRGIDLSACPSEDRQAYRERQYDLLADTVREHLNMDYIYKIMGLREEKNG